MRARDPFALFLTKTPQAGSVLLRRSAGGKVGQDSTGGDRDGSRRLLNLRSKVRTAALCSMLLAALWMMTVPVAGYAQTQTATSALT